MKRFKDVLIGVIIGCVLMISTPVLADTILTKIDVVLNGINVQIEGKDVEVDSILYKGTTYLPMRKVAELVGKDVDWNNDTNTANIVEKKASDIVNDENVKLIIDEKDPLMLLGIIVDNIEYYTISNLQWRLLPSLANKVARIAYILKQEIKEGKIIKQYITKNMSVNGYSKNEVILDNIETIEIEIKDFNGNKGDNRKITFITKEYYENTILPLIKK